MIAFVCDDYALIPLRAKSKPLPLPNCQVDRFGDFRRGYEWPLNSASRRRAHHGQRSNKRDGYDHRLTLQLDVRAEKQTFSASPEGGWQT